MRKFTVPSFFALPIVLFFKGPSVLLHNNAPPTLSKLGSDLLPLLFFFKERKNLPCCEIQALQKWHLKEPHWFNMGNESQTNHASLPPLVLNCSSRSLSMETSQKAGFLLNALLSQNYRRWMIEA